MKQNIQKPAAFLYTPKEYTEREFKNTMPFNIDTYKSACPTLIATDVVKYPEKNSLREKRFIVHTIQTYNPHCGGVTAAETWSCWFHHTMLKSRR